MKNIKDEIIEIIYKCKEQPDSYLAEQILSLLQKHDKELVEDLDHWMQNNLHGSDCEWIIATDLAGKISEMRIDLIKTLNQS